jgi:hypothetical protein
VCGEGVHIGPTKCESLAPLILFQDGAKVEMNSNPKMVPKVNHHTHVLLEILVITNIICHSLTNKMIDEAKYEKTTKRNRVGKYEFISY